MVCNFTGFNEEQYFDGVAATEAELLKQKPGANPLLIVAVTESHMTNAASERRKKTVELMTQNGITTTTAMVGVTGIKKTIAQAISKDVYFARDPDAAKEWHVAGS